MIDSTKRWYAVYTKSKFEKKVAQELGEKNVEYYLPLQKSLKQWSDRKKYVDEPLFKSYIFVRVSNQDYLEVVKTNGVVCYVTIGKEKIAIPDYQIEAVRTYLGEQKIDKAINYFEVGNEVEIAYGSLKGLRGELINAKDSRKLIVQIDAINQNISITLAAHLLKKIIKPSH
jgi:transcriptional antiterminator RfaH